METLIVSYPPPGDTLVEGKFLQLRLADRGCLLFAAAGEHRYHNQILARFLAESGIPHRWERTERLVVDPSTLVVIGGGRYLLDPVEGSLRVWDASGVYGRFDAHRLPAQLAAAGAPWNRLELGCG